MRNRDRAFRKGDMLCIVPVLKLGDNPIHPSPGPASDKRPHSFRTSCTTRGTVSPGDRIGSALGIPGNGRGRVPLRHASRGSPCADVRASSDSQQPEKPRETCLIVPAGKSFVNRPPPDRRRGRKRARPIFPNSVAFRYVRAGLQVQGWGELSLRLGYYALLLVFSGSITTVDNLNDVPSETERRLCAPTRDRSRSLRTGAGIAEPRYSKILVMACCLGC